ncbi:MAG: hypothetical protein ACK4NY_24845 [Spirosomataceae bacterium]
MLFKLYMMLFALKTATCSCNPEVRKSGFTKAKSQYTITKTGELPECINENSGLATAWQEGYYWTHDDSGGNPELYMIGENGRVYDTLAVNDAINVDWEDLAKDHEGNIYIGDFGNNTQSRKDLAIYKFKNGVSEKITFHYADQSTFPAHKRIFDCEAFFWTNDKLYLFSKSWDRTDRTTKLYEIPAKAGNYAITVKDSIYLKTPVTAADISPDGKQFALLTYGKIFVFETSEGKIDFSKPKNCIKIGRGQVEALAYINNTDFIVTNEQRKIYKVSLSK